MRYLSQYRELSQDRQVFFAANVDSHVNAKALADGKNYRFVAKHRTLIEQEFNQLRTILKKNSANDKTFGFYSYYCSLMLEAYYSAYDKPDKAAEYAGINDKLRQALQQPTFIWPQDDVDRRLTKKKIVDDLAKLARTPQQISKIRSWLGFFNIVRIQIVFSRLTVKQSLLLANELHWLAKLDSMLGMHRDVNTMVRTLDSMTPYFNLLSVGIFAARFMVNFSMLVKHTLRPSVSEQEFTWGERFKQEFNKRHCDFLNDIVWGCVNALTNYAEYFHIAAPVANWAIASFLVFDASLLIYRRSLEKADYLCKKAQLLHDKREAPAAQHSMLDEQLAQLERDWQTTSATYWFNVAAAMLMLSGFSASLLLASSISAPVCFFIVTIAVAMYISADSYGKYYQNDQMLQRDEVENKDTRVSLVNMQAARRDFMLAMAKNTFMPMLLLTTLAISWPAALVLTALYIGYESGKGYLQQGDAGQALPPPDVAPAGP